MKTKKMNKKGFEDLLKKVMGLVITAIVIILLLVLIGKTYAIIKDKNQQLKIQTQMEKITINAKKIHEQGGETRVEIFSPVGWYLRTFPDYDFPVGVCKEAVGCVCMCNTLDCTDRKECESFDFDVQLIHSVSLDSGYSPDSVEDRRHGGIVYTPEQEKQSGALYLSDALYEIKIVKENDIIKLIKVA